MTRCIVVLICFISVLLLIPVQGECPEFHEYEPETEINCCAVPYSEAKTGYAETNNEHFTELKVPKSHKPVYFKNHATGKVQLTIILLCVFRE